MENKVMAIKDILIHLTQDPRNAVRLELAVALARDHGAHLTALYVVPAPQIPGYFQAYVPDEVLNEQRATAQAAAEVAKAEFEAATEGAGVASEWRSTEGAFGDHADLHARYADLVVVGQRDPEAVGGSVYDLAEELVLVAGRPVLAVPYAGEFKTLGERVLVAWDGSREATRAVHDALPILERAKEVVVYRVNPEEAGHLPAADVAAHLARHGVKAEAHHTVSKIPRDETAVIGRRSIGIGDLLLSATMDFGSDLLVMGAYGHSRIRELVLGGSTRYILQHMTIPVLMSH
jgi:nucleotide-binding universal stress UspA family protein